MHVELQTTISIMCPSPFLLCKKLADDGSHKKWSETVLFVFFVVPDEILMSKAVWTAPLCSVLASYLPHVKPQVYVQLPQSGDLLPQGFVIKVSEALTLSMRL